MAAEEINAHGGVLGGRKIELVVEDDGGTPEKGAAGLRKLVSQDQVVAVVGQFHSSVTEAVQDLAEQLKVPVFMTQASAKRLTEKHLTYTFRTHVIDPDRVSCGQAGSSSRASSAWRIIAENTDYGIGLVEETKKAFAVDGRQGRAEDDHLRPRRRRPDAPAPRDQELEARPVHQRRDRHARCTSSASRRTTWG